MNAKLVNEINEAQALIQRQADDIKSLKSAVDTHVETINSLTQAKQIVHADAATQLAQIDKEQSDKADELAALRLRVTGAAAPVPAVHAVAAVAAAPVVAPVVAVAPVVVPVTPSQTSVIAPVAAPVEVHAVAPSNEPPAL